MNELKRFLRGADTFIVSSFIFAASFAGAVILLLQQPFSGYTWGVVFGLSASYAGFWLAWKRAVRLR